MPARRTSSKSFTIAGKARHEERQSSNKKEARYRLKKRSRKACAPRDPQLDSSTFKVVWPGRKTASHNDSAEQLFYSFVNDHQ